MVMVSFAPGGAESAADRVESTMDQTAAGCPAVEAVLQACPKRQKLALSEKKKLWRPVSVLLYLTYSSAIIHVMYSVQSQL